MNTIKENREANILNISEMIAQNSQVIDILSTKDIEGEKNQKLINYLDNVIEQVDNVDIISVVDNNGKRYYHPTKSEIGKVFVGGDEKRILSQGKSYISQAEGTLGKQLRAFSIVKDENGKQIGFVMVSTLIDNVNKTNIEMISSYLAIGIILLFICILLSIYLSDSIKETLLGYEPTKFAKLYLQKEEVLNSLEEGIVAVDNCGKINLLNTALVKMLRKKDKSEIEGKLITDIFENENILGLIKSKKEIYNKEILVQDEVIIVNSIPITEQKKLMGSVLIFRNKTEVTRLAEELTGVNQVIDALRANTHEFMNKLHVVLGLIQMDEIEEAKNYIVNINEEQKNLMHLIIDKIKDPTIAALIIGKVRRAKEQGIELNIDTNSYLENHNRFLSRNNLITILGNLIENAIDSINKKDDEIKEINLFIYNDEKSLMINIDDTGTGILEENLQKIYEKGFSTKGQNRGVGMYLIKNIVENCNGEINVESEVDVGTYFNIIINGV